MAGMVVSAALIGRSIIIIMRRLDGEKQVEHWEERTLARVAGCGATNASKEPKTRQAVNVINTFVGCFMVLQVLLCVFGLAETTSDIYIYASI